MLTYCLKDFRKHEPLLDDKLCNLKFGMNDMAMAFLNSVREACKKDIKGQWCAWHHIVALLDRVNISIPEHSSEFQTKFYVLREIRDQVTFNKELAFF